MVEPSNAFNPRARLLVVGAQPVGYLPDYLIGDLDHLEASSAGPSFEVVRINPSPTPAHHRVLVRLSAAWPAGFAPFSEERFEAVAARADAAE